MLKAAENLEFEEAARLRDEVRRLETVELAISDDPLARQSVINATENEKVPGAQLQGKEAQERTEVKVEEKSKWLYTKV